MCWGHMCVPTKRAESLFRASTLQEPFKPHTSTREERAEGSAASVLYERDYNATRSPPFLRQWKQAITPYPFTSLMGFSAMLLSVVMEHPLVKIHMASFVKIAASHNWNGVGVGGGSFPHYRPSGKCFRNFHSSLTSYIVFKVWLYIFKNLIR